MNKVVTYAQNREDVLLAGFFNNIEDGFYVDIGAHDPTKDSVTKYFYDRGWSGINVEPNPKHFKDLVRDRVRDINENVGIADKSGKLTIRIYDNGDGLSTFADDIKKDYEKRSTAITSKYTDKEVPVITLKELFDKHKVLKIDFLKIDIEGFEYNALVGNDWKRYRPQIICIEANHVTHDWRPLLQENGYEKVFFDGLNEYYVANEAKSLADSFSYIQSIIGKDIVDADTNEELKRLERAEYKLLNLQKKVQELEERELFLQAYIHEQSRLKSLLKNLVLKVDSAILLRLSRRVKAKKRYPAMEISESDDKGALLLAVKEADREVFVTQPNLLARLEILVFKSVLVTYCVSRKVLAMPLKYLKRQLRKKRSV